MPLIFYIALKKYELKILWISLLLTMLSSNNFVNAEPLTYSPDQWPRHWNALMNKTHLQNQLRGNNLNRNYTSQAPARSPVWGVVPKAKQKSRRSLRPEYNTNSHMRNYYGQNNYRGNYYSGFSNYALQRPYGAPMMNQYGSPFLVPGLAAPGIPFGAFPFMGGMPGMGHPW